MVPAIYASVMEDFKGIMAFLVETNKYGLSVSWEKPVKQIAHSKKV
ncbi:hypothetical protein I600_3278 [Maribacter dokdonensis DSW-8]|nr:hypothetical protein I600_3278 [Maribacter dokdonensis DSW-8]